MRDRHGNEVEIGDVVRVLDIAPETLLSLTEDERPRIEAMLYGEFEIDDIPEEHMVSVSICWQEGDGFIAYGGLYMLADEFELVRKAAAK